MSEHGESALGRSRPWRGCQGQDDLSCPGATHTEERGGPRAAVARSLGNWVGVGPYGRDLETEQRREVSLGSELCLEVAWDTAGPRVASPRARHHHAQAACGAHGGICGGLDGSPAGTCCSRPGQIPKAGSPPLHAFFLVSLWGALSPPPHRSPSSEGPRLLFFLSFPRRSSIFQENDSPRDEKLEGSAGRDIIGSKLGVTGDSIRSREGGGRGQFGGKRALQWPMGPHGPRRGSTARGRRALPGTAARPVPQSPQRAS